MIEKVCVTAGLAAIIVLALGGHSVAAETTVFQTQVPVSLVNSCTGESLTGTAELKIVSTSLEDGDAQLHLLVKGSLTSEEGVTYQYIVNNPIVKVRDGNLTQTVRNRLIGPGPSNNQFIKIVLNFYTDRPPEFEFSIECR